MDRDLEQLGAADLLYEIALSQRRTTRINRYIAILLTIVILALVAGAVLVVPTISRTIGEIQTAVTQLQGSLQGLSGLANQLGALSGSNDSQNLANALQGLGTIDFQSLSDGINRLNSLLEMLLRNFGQY